MSQRVVAYEGEGRSRRPVYADEGRSAAAVGDPVAALGVLSVAGFHGDERVVPTGGAGPVERRAATPEELAAARAREAKPTHLTRGVAHDGHLPTPAPRPPLMRSTPSRTHEEPAMATTPPQDAQAITTTTYVHVEALGRLAKAASDAAIALEAKRQADVVWNAAQDALAAAWLEVKGTDAPASLDRQGVVTPSKPHNSAEKSRANGTSAMLARRTPAAAGGGSADRAMRVVAAMREGGSTKAAAKILGVSDARVRQLIDTVRKAGNLPDDVAAMIKRKPVASLS